MSPQNIFTETFLRTTDSLEECKALIGKIEDPLRQKYRTVKSRIASHYNEDTPFRVTFCGVFSSGKSTLINCLLRCEYKLPTGINPITKIVTRIKYGQELACFYVYQEEQKKLDKEQTLKIIQGSVSLPEGCSEVTLKMPAEILKWNVEFLDTPGFNEETGGELEAMSRRAIADADMVVLCCNALQLGKMLERELITELQSMVGNFCMVITRMDSLNAEEEAEEVKRKAEWLIQGCGNLAMISDASGRYFTTACIKQYVTLGGFDTYLENILSNNEKRSAIRRSTDRLSILSVVAELSRLSDETSHEIDLAPIRGELPQQKLQEQFVNDMETLMERASQYCPQCGRAMQEQQIICPVCGRIHQIKVRRMNQETKEKLYQISHLISRDSADYSICWNMEARKIAQIITQTKGLAAIANMPGVTGMLQNDLEKLLSHCRDAEFQIAIVGVMKAGKSMLMNALMGAEIASVDINPETASLTKFRSADHYYIKIHFHNKDEWDKLCSSAEKSASSKLSKLIAEPQIKKLSQKWLGHTPIEKRCETEEELREEVAHWTSARSHDHLFASEVEVGIDNRVFDMPDEVIFVDTPGLHDPVQYRSKITKEYIKKANAVLIAVPARALTAEGLGTITTVLDYIGTRKEKAYIVATQKDCNSNRECEKVIKGWADHLVDAKRYLNEKEAQEHIIVTSGKMHLLIEKFTKLPEEILMGEIKELQSGDADSSKHFDAADFSDLEAYAKSTLKKFFKYDIFSLREKPEDAKALVKDSGIPVLRDCLTKNLLSRYKELKMKDIRDEYVRCRLEMTAIAQEAQKINEEMLHSAQIGTDELRKKLDESSKAYENAKKKNKEIREAAEKIREFNNSLIESL